MYKNTRKPGREMKHLWNPFHIFLTFIVIAICCDTSFGAVTVKSRMATVDNAGVTYYDTGDLSEMEIIETLQSDIQTLDDDIAKCEKQSKGWIAATVIGGVGIVGTGAAAIAQASKVSDKKSELSGLQQQAQELDTQIESTNKQITDMQ